MIDKNMKLTPHLASPSKATLSHSNKFDGLRLTPHFTLGEMVASKSHPEINNVPTEPQIMNLITVCQWLEKLREEYNRRYVFRGESREEREERIVQRQTKGESIPEEPIVINSGFRSKMLNYVVGGEQDSNHLTGCAADIRCKDCTQAVRYAALLIELFQKAKKDWDEIIIEKKSSKGRTFWVHFAVRPERNRCKVTCITL